MKIYRIAKEEKPYKIILLTPSGAEKVGEVDAHSDIQARRIFLQQDTQDYAVYLEMGYTIKAMLDKDELKRRKEMEKREDELKEEQVQESWWNKY